MKQHLVAMVCVIGVFGAMVAVSVPRAAFGQAQSDAGQGQSEVRQPGAVYDFDFKAQKPAPAPRRDISGVWEPAVSASAGMPSVTRLIHKICSGSSGNGIPIKGASSITHSSPTLPARIYWMNLRMLS